MIGVQLLIGDRDAAANSAVTFARQNPMSGKIRFWAKAPRELRTLRRQMPQ
jgi:hypothetical protein